MSDEDDHVAAVEAWRNGISDLPSSAMLAAFERAFAIVWRRAHTTLGDVTLTAIGDRVLHDASMRFPNLAGARLEIDGLDTRDLRDRVADRRVEAVELLSFSELVLTELLTVIGTLTAEVLSPALHRALATATRTHDETEADE